MGSRLVLPLEWLSGSMSVCACLWTGDVKLMVDGRWVTTCPIGHVTDVRTDGFRQCWVAPTLWLTRCCRWKRCNPSRWPTTLIWTRAQPDSQLSQDLRLHLAVLTWMPWIRHRFQLEPIRPLTVWLAVKWSMNDFLRPPNTHCRTFHLEHSTCRHRRRLLRLRWWDRPHQPPPRLATDSQKLAVLIGLSFEVKVLVSPSSASHRLARQVSLAELMSNIFPCPTSNLWYFVIFPLW